MYRTLIPALVAFALTLAMPALVKAADSVQEATVVIYRADESPTTDRLTFGLLGEGQLLGRIKADKSLSAEVPAGTYTLSTTLPGAEPITVELKPGAVHYIHADLRVVGNRVYADMTEVEEQVARNHGAGEFRGTI